MGHRQIDDARPRNSNIEEGNIKISNFKVGKILIYFWRKFIQIVWPPCQIGLNNILTLIINFFKWPYSPLSRCKACFRLLETEFICTSVVFCSKSPKWKITYFKIWRSEGSSVPPFSLWGMIFLHRDHSYLEDAKTSYKTFLLCYWMRKCSKCFAASFANVYHSRAKAWSS